MEPVYAFLALSSVRFGPLGGACPLEELIFAFTFGLYWSSRYEHLTWHGTGRIGGSPR